MTGHNDRSTVAFRIDTDWVSVHLHCSAISLNSSTQQSNSGSSMLDRTRIDWLSLMSVFSGVKVK
ncbi:MAG: hypothetical protein ACRCS6_08175 [Turicibacter sp.]